jgi:hypothetical protein
MICLFCVVGLNVFNVNGLNIPLTLCLLIFLKKILQINGSFLLLQLLIDVLLCMKSVSKDMNEYIIECAKEYKDCLQLKQVEQFYKNSK